MNIQDSANKENLQPGKNTKCEAKLNFRLENPGSRCKNERKNKEEFPLWLELHFLLAAVKNLIVI